MLYNWFNEIDFCQPLVFFQFAWIPVLIYVYVRQYNRKQAAIRVSTIHSFQVNTAKASLRHLPFVLRLLAISCLIVALARPQNETTSATPKEMESISCFVWT